VFILKALFPLQAVFLRCLFNESYLKLRHDDPVFSLRTDFEIESLALEKGATLDFASFKAFKVKGSIANSFFLENHKLWSCQYPSHPYIPRPASRELAP